MRGAWLLPAALTLSAQTQPTFYAAWQDGLDAEHAARWQEAAAAYRRALELRPAPAARAFTYGNNLIRDYYPRTRLARCLVELGDLDGAEGVLSAAQGEPSAAREALATRIASLRTARIAASVPAKPEQVSTSAPPADPARPQVAPPPSAAASEQTSAQTQAQAQAASGSPSPGAIPISPAPDRRLPATEPPSPPQPQTQIAPSLPAPSEPPPLPRWLPWAAGLGLVALAAALFGRRRRRPLFSQAQPADSRGLEYAPPSAVGPYRVGPLLGRGGFSSTYLAWHQETGQEVALKLPHPHRLDDSEFQLRFRREAQLGAQLDHPNLVRILDPGPPEGVPYLAMEYIPGPTLDQRLKEGGPLPIEEARAIALDVARAMAYAHGRGVVHRDLKPGNILLTGAGARVMDLGIARVMDAATVTTTYAFLGTPLYAAPEAQLKTHVGPAADRYSLGVILFHMLAGAPPFQGETPFEILDRHRTAQPPDLRSLRPEVPPVLARLVARLLDKEPDQRPDDEEVVNLLMGRIPLMARPEGAPRD
ncbi:serine/threonine-protein kinase [Geothrix terrae]|uniref:serine/threonine-protein kinase n=1 Tax=Geothrix terrae TaxID=2922720 RepID=UPI001FAB6E14|nr:serine/threonine-protein kinase [Geothrix terrae]